MSDSVDPDTERINLRCPKCGEMRRPVISPHLPDKIVVICDTCWKEHLRRLPWTT
jgi:uncharacterized Zn finger protein